MIARRSITALSWGAAALAVAAPAAAQTPALPPVLDDRVVVRVGAGGTSVLTHPGAEHDLGPALMAAMELPVVPGLWVRTALGGSLQELRTRPGSPLSGDVQQAHFVATARWTPLATPRIAPYLLAGGGVFWQSDRFTLDDPQSSVPGAAYRQTSSHHARGAVLGAGMDVALGGASLFLESQWTRVGSPDGARTDLSVTGGLTLRFAR